MRLAVDCRMYGKSGIGSFLAGVLPFLCADGDMDSILLLAGEAPVPGLDGLVRDFSQKAFLLHCGVKPFSIRELLFFPRKLAAMINSCDCYFSPYCNVPAGIKIPVYTTIHDLVFLDFPGLAGRVGVLARKILYKYAVFRSKAVFTVSEFSRGRILELLSCRKPVYVACNGIPRFLEDARRNGRLEGRTADTSAGASDPQEDFVIFVGNIKAHKGLRTLLEAFPAFRAKTGARLVIVGSAENFRTKDEAVSRLLAGGMDGIEFTGYVSDEKLVDLLSSARLL
ncbi:MAG: glycosyltransferase, partial [Treponema sp.]|nr:glycosyltransferase [Treponema sp.]